MNWLFFALMTVLSWGVYGIFLHMMCRFASCSIPFSVGFLFCFVFLFFFFQAEDGIRGFCLSRGLGDVYKSLHFKYVKASESPGARGPGNG